MRVCATINWVWAGAKQSRASRREREGGVKVPDVEDFFYSVLSLGLSLSLSLSFWSESSRRSRQRFVVSVLSLKLKWQ